MVVSRLTDVLDLQICLTIGRENGVNAVNTDSLAIPTVGLTNKHVKQTANSAFQKGKFILYIINSIKLIIKHNKPSKP